MTLESRITTAVGLMIAGTVLHLGFVWYLEAAGPMPTIHLREPLEKMPMTLGEWEGQDIPKAEGAVYGDDFLFRTYKHSRTQQQVTVWAVYSEVGEDRGHHPDVCMKVAGKTEDTRVRQTISVGGHDAPVQQYRFLDADGSQWVFYWHYTLLPSQTMKMSDAQRNYQRMHKRPSSITIEIFAPERVLEDAEGAVAFVHLIDTQLQPFLGSGAERGSNRTSVMVVDEDARPGDGH